MISMTQKIRVLIVEDSRFMQKALSTLLANDPMIEVVGTAHDPYEARDMIREHRPDALTLDIEMPRMDGITFLEKLMAAHPMPVVMISAISAQNAAIAIRALELGAFDVIAKPADGDMQGLIRLRDEVRLKVKAAAQARIDQNPTRMVQPVGMGILLSRHSRVIGIGASTGGVEALRALLTAMPEACPPIVITQHMPPVFTASFAKRLDQLGPLRVYEAADGQVLKNGEVYIAPGDRHLELKAGEEGWQIALQEGEPVSGHCPSVDVMFRSLAQTAGARVIGVLLTGMGHDGAQGLLELRKAGAVTLAQDEKSCVVFGMPGAAAKIGAVEQFVPLSEMAQTIVRRCQTLVTAPIAASS